MPVMMVQELEMDQVLEPEPEMAQVLAQELEPELVMAHQELELRLISRCSRRQYTNLQSRTVRRI